MAKLEFKDLSFEEKGSKAEIILLKNFSFEIEKSKLSEIAQFKLSEHSIEFRGADEKWAAKKFDLLLSAGMPNLKSRISGRPAVYIHQNSGIPLIGSLSFGIVDKGTSMIEVKPITGCELNCLFCSVNEGITSKKQTDFVVEEQYLLNELKRLLDYKQCGKMQIFINPHGEPLMYAGIVQLVRDISRLEGVELVSMMTNGNLLTKKIADELISAGIRQINLSLNAISAQAAKKLAGTAKYDVDKVIEVAEYISKKIKLVLAPVWLDGVNDEEIEKIIGLSKKLKCGVGIQKFCSNKRGRNPAKEIGWDEFYEKLKELEKKHDVKLIGQAETIKTKELPKPFKKGEIVKARVVCNGRNRNEKLAAAKERIISLPACLKEGEVRVKIVQDKHNVFIGALA